MSLAQFMHTMQQIGQQPSLGQRFMQGQQEGREEADRQLLREQQQREWEMREQMFPFQLQKLEAEAALAGQPKLTDKARQVEEMVREGIPRNVAVMNVYGSERTYVDPQTNNIIQYNPLEAYLNDIGGGGGRQSAPMDAEGQDISGRGPSVGPQGGGRVLAHGTRQEERAEKQQRELNLDVRSYAQDLEKSGIPKVKAQLNEIDSKIRGILPDDIPGLGSRYRILGEGGIISNMASGVPIAREIIDTVLGGAEKWLHSEEGKEIRQLFQQLANDYIKEMAGTAVSGSEEERMLRALGQTNWSSPQEALIGMEYIRRLTEAREENLKIGYGEDVVEEYERRRQGLRTPATTPESEADDTTGGFSLHEHAARNPDGTAKAYRDSQTGVTVYLDKRTNQWVTEDGKPYEKNTAPDTPQPPSSSVYAPPHVRNPGAHPVAKPTPSTQPEAQSTPVPTPQQLEPTPTPPPPTGRPEVAPGYAPDRPPPEADPVEETIATLQGELDAKKITKKAAEDFVRDLLKEGTIDRRQFMELMRRLGLGTYDSPAADIRLGGM